MSTIIHAIILGIILGLMVDWIIGCLTGKWRKRK